MTAHVGDHAELYALGALEASEREAVDTHLATCDACTRRVAEAERTVDALGTFVWDASAATPVRRNARRMRWSAVAALLAACLVPALGFGLRERASLAAIESNDASIVATLATSHFAHTSFVANVAGAPFAKVLYARNGSWLYIVVDASGTWDLSGTSNGKPIDFGRLASRGPASILYVRPHAHVDDLMLAGHDGTNLAHVHLTYDASP